MHRVHAIVRTDTSTRACLSQLIDNTKFVLVPGPATHHVGTITHSGLAASVPEGTRLIFTRVSAVIFHAVWPQIRFLPDFFLRCLRKKRKNCAGARCYRPLSRILPHYVPFSFYFPLVYLIVVAGKANNAATFACKWLKAKVKALEIHLSRLFYPFFAANVINELQGELAGIERYRGLRNYLQAYRRTWWRVSSISDVGNQKVFGR